MVRSSGQCQEPEARKGMKDLWNGLKVTTKEEEYAKLTKFDETVRQILISGTAVNEFDSWSPGVSLFHKM